QTFGLEVEAADGVDVLVNAAEEIDHRRSALRIRSRRDVAAWLVEQEIAMLLDKFDAAAVDADLVVQRVGLAAELTDGRAVHRDAAVEHQLLRRPARRDAGLRQDLLQTLHGLQRTSRWPLG